MLIPLWNIYTSDRYTIPYTFNVHTIYEVISTHALFFDLPIECASCFVYIAYTILILLVSFYVNSPVSWGFVRWNLHAGGSFWVLFVVQKGGVREGFPEVRSLMKMKLFKYHKLNEKIVFKRALGLLSSEHLSVFDESCSKFFGTTLLKDGRDMRKNH